MSSPADEQFDTKEKPGTSGTVASRSGKAKEKKRVGFTSDLEPSPHARDGDEDFSPPTTGNTGTSTPTGLGSPGNRESFNRDELSAALEKIISPEHHSGAIQRPRPVLRKLQPNSSDLFPGIDAKLTEESEVAARNRADQLAVDVGTSSWSAPGSRRNSVEAYTASPEYLASPVGHDASISNEEGYATGAGPEAASQTAPRRRARSGSHTAAHELVQAHARRASAGATPDVLLHSSGLRSGQITPVDHELEYVPRPNKYQGGVLGSLLKLYNEGKDTSGENSVSPGTPNRTPRHSPSSSVPGTPPTTRPRSGLFGLKTHHSSSSVTTLAGLVGSSSSLAAPGSSDITRDLKEKLKQEQDRPKRHKRAVSGVFAAKAAKLEDEIRITKHIARIISRHRYLVKLCRALMMYGAPTHRLEAYLAMSARVLGIEGQFLYMPGCMIISFDDSSTHTTEMKIVRTDSGVDLGKLHDTHEIYKLVVHDLIGVDEAIERLDKIMSRRPRFNKWVCVLASGLTSMCVAPFAFEGRFIDMPMVFLLGCILGSLQLLLAPSSELYSNVFEITAAVIISFLARALGSIRGGELFCFSAMAQSSIALILPGYMVLCSSLELQSHYIVAGSVRLVYAMIYTLFLGYGITIGSVLYGYIDHNATSALHCTDPLNTEWYWRILFVTLATVLLCILNQAKWKQMPVMILISLAGYCVNNFSAGYFKGNPQVSNTLGALAVGVLANLYSRLGRHVENFALDVWEFHLQPRIYRLRGRGGGGARKSSVGSLPGYGAESDPEKGLAQSKEAAEPSLPRKIGYGMAAAAMLPAIFVQVPSGLAINGTLLSGITSANQLINSSASSNSSSQQQPSSGTTIDTSPFVVLISVIQIAIGISVGLSLSALLVYPFGKRRSGLFSF